MALVFAFGEKHEPAYWVDEFETKNCLAIHDEEKDTVYVNLLEPLCRSNCDFCEGFKKAFKFIDILYNYRAKNRELDVYYVKGGHYCMSPEELLFQGRNELAVKAEIKEDTSED